MNQAGRWFALLTGKLIRRGARTSVPGPGKRHQRIDHHPGRQPAALHLDQAADEILTSLADYLTKLGAGQPVNTHE